jgi:AraC-like DNA-binding protein
MAPERPAEDLDGDMTVILLRLLREADWYVDRDRLAAHSCLDRASALLESERSRSAHSRAVRLPLGEKPLAPWQVRRVTAYVSENLAGVFGIHELAQLTRLEARGFLSAFRATFGISVQDYISIRRMNLACILLLTTDQSLQQVALACGLPDQDFSEIFAHLFGEPPDAWRRARQSILARGGWVGAQNGPGRCDKAF